LNRKWTLLYWVIFQHLKAPIPSKRKSSNLPNINVWSRGNFRKIVNRLNCKIIRRNIKKLMNRCKIAYLLSWMRKIVKGKWYKISFSIELISIIIFAIKIKKTTHNFWIWQMLGFKGSLKIQRISNRRS
jgi:hypothetical protein